MLSQRPMELWQDGVESQTLTFGSSPVLQEFMCFYVFKPGWGWLSKEGRKEASKQRRKDGRK